MNRKIGLGLLAVIALLVAVIGSNFIYGWNAAGPLKQDMTFQVPDGASLAKTASILEQKGAIKSASAFLQRARILGGGDPIKAGEFAIPAGASNAQILGILQGNDVVRRFVMVPEGMPSVLVHEKLMAEPLLTGEIPIPQEGSILPESYAFERGETRAAVLKRMQDAMTKALAEAWAKRSAGIAVSTPQEAVILASIVEKETGKPSERRTVAGLYSNRLKKAMMLQADPTIIYPITKGRPLGRRIRESEIRQINDYNTYSMVGLPKGPITNPGLASIEAVLKPAKTDALFMVADGTGGHKFAATVQEHNANVEKWFAIRRQRGEM